MNEETEKYLKSMIRDVPDFPTKGVVFKDITTLIKDPWALNVAIYEMKRCCHGTHIDRIASIESRGFIFGSILSQELGVGFVPVRKRNKLPAAKMLEEYELEYGTDAVEIHKDAVERGARVLIVDDLLATGGTADATARLIEKLGGEVIGFLFLIELSSLNGRDKLSKHNICSLLKYDS